MRFTIEEIARAVDGVVHGRGEDTVDGVGIDSRASIPGELFVALVADRDGHEFVPAAVEAGAAGLLVSREPDERGSRTRSDGAPWPPAVRVADTARALTRLGAHARDRLTGPVVGVTGSVGKTSVKDLLRTVGATTWSTWANPGSFNNELGVPLTLGNAPEGTELTIVEMGARGIGHIAELCETARPTVGIVTVVAGAHLELFESIDAVARAKAELPRALPAGGFAVLNADDPRVRAMAGGIDAEVVTFGIHSGDVRAEDIRMDDSLRARFRLVSPWGAVEIGLGVAGRHQIVNALGASAAALVLGASPEAIADGLNRAELSAHRMSLSTGAGGVRILDDSYNANPTSMLAALDALAALPADRRVAVLGTMAELGPDSDAAHRRIAEAAGQRQLELITVGEPAYGVVGEQAVATVADAVELLRSRDPGDETAVLVKASRSAGLERIVAGLGANPGSA